MPFVCEERAGGGVAKSPDGPKGRAVQSYRAGEGDIFIPQVSARECAGGGNGGLVGMRKYYFNLESYKRGQKENGGRFPYLFLPFSPSPAEALCAHTRKAPALSTPPNPLPTPLCAG
eukprot:Hpha_TRINITY_DN14919_c0_g1::TRINITY_DN14919_c0_g1_i1::g.143842::m.143842